MEAWLNQTADLVHLANKKVKVAKEEATSTTIRAMVEYKESDDFMNDATKAGVNAYIVWFTDCREKVAQTFLALDLSKILVPR